MVKKRSLSKLIPLTASHFSLTKQKRKKKKMRNPLTFDSLDVEADLTDAMLFPTSWEKIWKCIINSTMWIANIHRVQKKNRQAGRQAGWRMCQPTSERATLTLSFHHRWLTSLKTCSFFFPSVGCQRHCHRQGEATLSIEGHMWLGEEVGSL